MRRVVPLSMLLLVSHAGAAASEPAVSTTNGTEAATSTAEGVANAPVPPPLTGLVPDARWSTLATPIGAGHDGRGWIGGVGHELVVHDGVREVQRLPVATGGSERLAPLPDGRWLVGERVLDADGHVRFNGHSWCNRLGPRASCQAAAFSPDGAVAILAAADHPSTCLCDRGRDGADDDGGVLARMTFGTDPGVPTVRELISHEERRDFVVAASERWVAATDGRELLVWPAAGEGGPSTTTLDGGKLDRLEWAGNDLVGTRWIDTEHTEIVVLDGDDGHACSARWIVEGNIEAMAIRPGGEEIAIGTTWYRARETVEIDEKRIEVHALDGTLRVRIDVDGWPSSLAWSPRGDALLVAITNRTPERAEVVRYAVR